MKCQWFELADESPRGRFENCANEATLTCCDYGGHVCEQHKCRCSKPLECADPNPTIVLGSD